MATQISDHLSITAAHCTQDRAVSGCEVDPDYSIPRTDIAVCAHAQAPAVTATEVVLGAAERPPSGSAAMILTLRAGVATTIDASVVRVSASGLELRAPGVAAGDSGAPVFVATPNALNLIGIVSAALDDAERVVVTELRHAEVTSDCPREVLRAVLGTEAAAADRATETPSEGPGRTLPAVVIVACALGVAVLLWIRARHLAQPCGAYEERTFGVTRTRLRCQPARSGPRRSWLECGSGCATSTSRQGRPRPR